MCFQEGLEASTATAIRLFVGNLQQDVTETMLFEVFEEFDAASVSVCRDDCSGSSLGYGYANFRSEEDAIQAIGLKDGTVLNGSKIKVGRIAELAETRRITRNPNADLLKAQQAIEKAQDDLAKAKQKMKLAKEALKVEKDKKARIEKVIRSLVKDLKAHDVITVTNHDCYEAAQYLRDQGFNGRFVGNLQMDPI